MNDAAALARTTFTLPEGSFASEPPEARGLARDDIRLLVARPESLRHARFHELGAMLQPGDLVVVNTSATLAAAVDGTSPGGSPVVVHFSAPVRGRTWIVELRRTDGSGPLLDGAPGQIVYLPDGARLQLLWAHPDRPAGSSRLWRSRIDSVHPIEEYLARNGRPITYVYTPERWPLAAYQTIFAKHPGSAEMPSAGRPFTQSLVTDLAVRGINIAPLLLHTGVSSLEAGERPQDERFEVSASTAWLVNQTRAAGGLVIAVGTTVTRALETVARPNGSVVAGRGRTDLVLGPDRPARVVDGLITGWHPPQASHLSLLEAVAGSDLVQHAYDEAVATGYLWHEFGDTCLLLPADSVRRRRSMHLVAHAHTFSPRWR